MIVAIIALVALTIVTVGAFAAGAAALGTAIIVGVVAGGVVGGITAARSKNHDGWDIVGGILVGMAVGGWAAYGGGLAYAAIAKAMTVGILSGAVAGGVSGTINGAAMGFAAGFAAQDEITTVLLRMAEGALLGLVSGAALGALTGAVKSGSVEAPKDDKTISGGLRKETDLWTNRSSQQIESEAAARGQIPSAGDPGPAPKSGDFGDVAGAEGGRLAKIVTPSATYAAGKAGDLIWFHTLFVDLHAGAWNVLRTDIIELHKEGKIPKLYLES